MKPFRAFLVLVCALSLHSTPAGAQILHAEELNTEQFRTLDRGRTIVMFVGTLLEEHGPYLPAGSDGFQNQRLADGLAEAILAELPGWTVLMMPGIPLGTDQANTIGNKFSFSGTFAVRAATLRAVYMDLAAQLGEQHYRWVFIVDSHGGPAHQRALQQAGDYFHDTYGGAMVALANLKPVMDSDSETAARVYTPEQKQEEGFTVHAGGDETSAVLFARPDLVSPAYKSAPPWRGNDFADLVRLASKPDWPGYFGSPRLGNTKLGEAMYNGNLQQLLTFARTVLNGGDISRVPQYADPRNRIDANDPGRKHDDSLAAQQAAWLRRKGYDNR